MGRRHYNILFSIPVHEKTEVVLDQIVNIQHFNPKCCIVLHISRGFDYASEYLNEASFFHVLEKMDDVLINPNRLRSGLEDIIQCHISNFRYAFEHVDFDYIMFSASNELFFKFGLWNDIKNYDCGPSRRSIIREGTEWAQGRRALEDNGFKDAINSMGISQIFEGQFEGSYMKRDMMHKLSDIIESFYDYQNMTIKYAREEVFFHTFIAALYPDVCIRNDNTTYMNWGNNLRVSVADVMNLVRYDNHYFSLKRVPRNINDEVRTFIRDYVGKYSKELDMFFTNRGMAEVDSSVIISNKRNELKCDLYQKWVTMNQSDNSICNYLIENKLTVVSIYGYGEIGKMLHKELIRNDSIEIESIMDKNYVDESGAIMISGSFPKLNRTKLIIVTVLMDEELLEKLKDNYSVPCIEIDELINGSMRTC